MVRGARLVWAMAAALALGGCRKEEAPPPDVSAETTGEAVEILRKFPASSAGGIREASDTLIADAKTWEETWAKANAHFAPVPKAPTVDFSKERVAFAALGEKPTAGWSVEIVGLRVEEGKFRILFALREPSAEEAGAKVVTRPWHAVVVPVSALPVEWVRYVPPAPKKRK